MDIIDYKFTRNELELIFESCINKTLGQLDRFSVFSKAINNPKITGIAGDIVEQSILGMRANSRQMPDLLVDGEEIELKTTGLRKRNDEYVPKEPVTITAVSIDRIVNEENFLESTLWHKLNKILFIYYHYNSDTTVQALGYREFEILSYQFYKPSEADEQRYHSDWIIVRDFLRSAKNSKNPAVEYPLLSTNINPELVVLDTAPKYPNPPRFRIRKRYFALIVSRHFNRELEQLPDEYASFKELYEKLKELTTAYKDKSIKELAEIFEFDLSRKVTKQISEQIIVRMFGGTSKKLSKLELFQAFRICAYSIALSSKDKRTEDTKMCPIDFDEVMEDKPFEESEFYKYFTENKFVFFVLKEQQTADKTTKIDFTQNRFLGFKLLSFSEEFVYSKVKPVWDRIRHLINTNTLIEEDDAPNFTKSRENDVFVRGTGRDIYDKPVCINGIKMYRQNVWVKGKTIVDMLNNVDFM